MSAHTNPMLRIHAEPFIKSDVNTHGLMRDVLLAMGRTAEQALGSLRFSVGYGNDEAQIDEAAQRLQAVLERSG